MDDVQRFAMDEWLGRVEAAAIEQQEHHSSDELQRVVHLVDHGAPAEALLALAWILDDKVAATPASVRGQVTALVGNRTTRGRGHPAVTMQVYAHVLQDDDSTAAETTATAIFGP